MNERDLAKGEAKLDLNLAATDFRNSAVLAEPIRNALKRGRRIYGSSLTDGKRNRRKITFLKI